ncbi:MAG TPA: F0F1 ATP synthase subunit epsilon [Acidobacteriota bacterium]|nr:F0F1 ATP synthase subunit epsilon [Acidobacteriota bacterium]
MRLKLLLPSQVVVDQKVAKVVAEGEHGSFCLLPRHVDFLAALVPGLLAFEDEEGREQFAAVDEGVLVKRGDEVLVSTRQATRGADLEELRQTVRQEFVSLSEREKAAQAATAKLEASFLRSYLKLAEEQP